MNFMALFDPSTTLGAFLISILASLIVGFFGGKKFENYTINKSIKKNVQKNENVYGDIYQGSTIKNDKEKD